MAKRKEAPKIRMGENPFDSMDVEWLERAEGATSVEVLGHDPFKGLEMGWLEQEREQPIPDAVPVPADQVVVGPIAGGPMLYPLDLAGADARSMEQAVAGPGLPLEPRQAERATERLGADGPLPQVTFRFPAGFKWGAVVAAHSVEGSNTNTDWWTWEQQNGHIRQAHVSGLACNWWRDAEADFDRAAAVGLNALRLSVEWARIEPSPGQFDEAALRRYAEMLHSLRQRNIEPMVTLHHFTNPLWLTEHKGWENRKTVGLFSRFVRHTVSALRDYCDLWCTIHEPNTYAYLGYLEGVYPPGRSDLGAAARVIRNMLLGHAAAYREIHALQPRARVGLAHHMLIMDPARPETRRDPRVARRADLLYNAAILDALARGHWAAALGGGVTRRLRHTLDWIGLDYHSRDLVSFDRAGGRAPLGRRTHSYTAELLEDNYGEFYPAGIYRCLARLANLGLPIYITENGIPDGDDNQRPRFLLAHLHQVWRAVQACYPVAGYYHRTLVDSFEWTEGWTRRFGLFALDPATQARAPRRSATLYGSIALSNALSSAMLDEYAPQLRAELLPTHPYR